jgi:hypothetical protein
LDIHVESLVSDFTGGGFTSLVVLSSQTFLASETMAWTDHQRIKMTGASNPVAPPEGLGYCFRKSTREKYL